MDKRLALIPFLPSAKAELESPNSWEILNQKRDYVIPNTQIDQGFYLFTCSNIGWTSTVAVTKRACVSGAKRSNMELYSGALVLYACHWVCHGEAMSAVTSDFTIHESQSFRLILHLTAKCLLAVCVCVFFTYCPSKMGFQVVDNLPIKAHKFTCVNEYVYILSNR